MNSTLEFYTPVTKAQIWDRADGVILQELGNPQDTPFHSCGRNKWQRFGLYYAR